MWCCFTVVKPVLASHVVKNNGQLVRRVELGSAGWRVNHDRRVCVRDARDRKTVPICRRHGRITSTGVIILLYEEHPVERLASR